MEMEFPMKKNEAHTILVLMMPMVSLSYCNLISSRVPKGKWRLISVLPILYIFTILPLYVTSTFLTTLVSFSITWLASFKLLLFAFDKGPLSCAKSLPLFIAVASLPFQIKPKINSKTDKKLIPLNLATQIPISLFLIQILLRYKLYIHPYALLLLYCCLVFLFVEVLVALSSSVARVLFRIDLQQPSDEPYLSTSLREFWGKRWNLIVAGLLKDTVYKPIRACGGSVVVGVIATFLVSGLMHEMIFWYATPSVRPSWETTAFFVVQGLGVWAELRMEKWLRNMPAIVRGVFTLGFVVVTSFWLFFPSLIRNGADVRVVEELGYVSDIFKLKLKLL